MESADRETGPGGMAGGLVSMLGLLVPFATTGAKPDSMKQTSLMRRLRVSRHLFTGRSTSCRS